MANEVRVKRSNNVVIDCSEYSQCESTRNMSMIRFNALLKATMLIPSAPIQPF